MLPNRKARRARRARRFALLAFLTSHHAYRVRARVARMAPLPGGGRLEAHS